MPEPDLRTDTSEESINIFVHCHHCGGKGASFPIEFDDLRKSSNRSPVQLIDEMEERIILSIDDWNERTPPRKQK